MSAPIQASFPRRLDGQRKSLKPRLGRVSTTPSTKTQDKFFEYAGSMGEAEELGLSEGVIRIIGEVAESNRF